MEKSHDLTTSMKRKPSNMPTPAFTVCWNKLNANRVCGCCVGRALMYNAAVLCEQTMGSAEAVEMLEGIIDTVRSNNSAQAGLRGKGNGDQGRRQRSLKHGATMIYPYYYRWVTRGTWWPATRPIWRVCAGGTQRAVLPGDPRAGRRTVAASSSRMATRWLPAATPCESEPMKPLPFYNTTAWRRKARKQALHDAGYTCQRCGVSLAGMRWERPSPEAIQGSRLHWRPSH